MDFSPTFRIRDRLNDDSTFCVDMDQQSLLSAVADCGAYQADTGANFVASKVAPTQSNVPNLGGKKEFGSVAEWILFWYDSVYRRIRPLWTFSMGRSFGNLRLGYLLYGCPHKETAVVREVPREGFPCPVTIVVFPFGTAVCDLVGISLGPCCP